MHRGTLAELCCCGSKSLSHSNKAPLGRGAGIRAADIVRPASPFVLGQTLLAYIVLFPFNFDVAVTMQGNKPGLVHGGYSLNKYNLLFHLIRLHVTED